MQHSRSALIIASYIYQDKGLRKLLSPAKDAETLDEVLRDEAIGNFDPVNILLNEPSYRVCECIEGFFDSAKPEQLLLFYFSGHGIKDKDGKLYFAAYNTKKNRLRTTAIPASLIHDLMYNSRSRQQVLILDCCYSGAFPKGMLAKSGDQIDIKDVFEIHSHNFQCRVILTASDAMQYSFEGEKIFGKGTPSNFTAALIEGLKTGKADTNFDGIITIRDAFEYTKMTLDGGGKLQNPRFWTFGDTGEIVIAKNPNSHLKCHQEEVKINGDGAVTCENTAIQSEDGTQLPEMVSVPPGPFLIGSVKNEREKPEHQLSLDAFSIGLYLVTNREYMEYVDDTGCNPPSHWKCVSSIEEIADHPVVHVTWHDAKNYCHWLEKKTGRPYRLPSEAEWEKAAGWGPESNKKREYPWGDNWDREKCNCLENGLNKTTPVKNYPEGRSYYGIFDAAGNVAEWCNTQYLPYPYRKINGRENESSIDKTANRVVRGGSFSDSLFALRCSFRYGKLPESSDWNLGFRLAL